MKWGRVGFPEQTLAAAHAKSSTVNLDSAKRSILCGCFQCCKVFPAKQIIDTVVDAETFFCPYCSIDAVLFDADVPLVCQKSFLYEMQARYFSRDSM